MWSPKEELCKDTYDPCRHYASEQLSVELGEEYKPVKVELTSTEVKETESKDLKFGIRTQRPGYQL